MSQITNQIVIIAGGKGGVGKTVVTCVCASGAVSAGTSPVIVDCDDSNPDVYKSWRRSAESQVCGLDEESGFLALGDLIEAHPSVPIVVNTAARQTRALIEHGDLLAEVARKQGRKIIVTWPINRQRDSLELLADFMDGTGWPDRVWVAVNTYFGPRERFSRYDSSQIKQRVTGTIIIPELHDVIADKINEKRSNYLTAHEHLSITEGASLRRFREVAMKAMEEIYD
jgi:hypothetical protein